MNNKEFYKIIREIFAKVDDYTNEDVSITNISELFIVKTYKSILEYGKRNSAEIIANEFYCIWALDSDTENETDDKDDYGLQVYSEPIPEQKSKELENNGMLFLFRVLQYTIENFPRVEKILLDIGFNDPMKIIDKAKRIKVIEDEQQTIEEISSFLQEFDIENPKVKFFISLSFFYSSRDYLIGSLSLCTKEFLLQGLKIVKEIGDNYTRECNEKVGQYMYIISRFDKFLEAHGMALIRIANRFTTFFKENKISTENIWEYFINKNMSDSALSFTISSLFIVYHFLYQKPEYLVKFIFSLLHNDKIPYNLQQKLCASFKEEDYAPIFQYEYEWYCRQNNIQSIVPIRFYYGNPVDLKSFGIEDYDLYNKQNQLDKQERCLIENIPQQIEQAKTVQKCDILSHIDHELYPYYTLFDESRSENKGHTFRKVHLPSLITYAEEIKDSYSVYGFTYLLYKSQYLNWKDTKFDDTFVRSVASLFGIDDKLDKSYTESKAKQKAWKILKDGSNSITDTLLSGRELELLSFGRQ